MQAIQMQPAAQPHVVVVQAGGQDQKKPPNYLCLAVFVMLCCDFPLGLVAVICAAVSDSNYNEGDIEAASNKGKIALCLSIFSIITTVGFIIFVVVFCVVVAKSFFGIPVWFLSG
ncbi:unnamed protein product [Owenia fusiformis]|uniref:Uncharacterized protein n=1 Tax=Owenia fusiformis TaxID=6347 RepID=A0A8J1TWP2_OWEFU|nr:unnamed protein product [Owenia fusiformis]